MEQLKRERTNQSRRDRSAARGIWPGSTLPGEFRCDWFSSFAHARTPDSGSWTTIPDLYAFNPKRLAILLIGGDKTGNDLWYQVNVPMADRLYDRHMEELREEKDST